MFTSPNQFRITEGKFATKDSEGNSGSFLIPLEGVYFNVVASDDSGWETIAIRPQNRGFDMRISLLAHFKKLFWGDTDLVIQYIESSKDGAVHLWRRRNSNDYVKTPPKFLNCVMDTTERFILDKCLARLNASRVPYQQHNDVAFSTLTHWKRSVNIKPSEIMEHLEKQIKKIEQTEKYA